MGTAACVGCNPNPGMAGGMYYVGPGGGDYMAQSTYRYVGYGGDFSSVRRRRDFTCLLLTLLSLALLFLVWWWWPVDECYSDQNDWQYKWTRATATARAHRMAMMAPPSPIKPMVRGGQIPSVHLCSIFFVRGCWR